MKQWPTSPPSASASGSVRGWTGLKRLFGLSGAAVCIALATAGIVLPLLPSTPFALLAAFLLLRCSPAWHARLLQSRIFGGLLRDWNELGGIRPREKLKAIAIVISVGGASIVFARPAPAIAGIVVVLLATGITVVALLPTARRQQRMRIGEGRCGHAVTVHSSRTDLLNRPDSCIQRLPPVVRMGEVHRHLVQLRGDFRDGRSAGPVEVGT